MRAASETLGDIRGARTQSRLESIRVDTGRGSEPDVLAPRDCENSESSKKV